MNGFRGSESVLHALANGRAFQIVSGEKYPWQLPFRFANGFDYVSVPQIVLRQGSRVLPHCRGNRRANDFQYVLVLALNDLRDLIFRLICNLWICSATGEAGYGHRAFRGASREERGIPDGAQCVQPFAGRNEETETVHGIAGLLAVVA